MKTFLQSFCFAFFALLCSTQTKAQCTTEGSSLATTNSGGHIHGSGIMFNITAKKNLTITCFDIALVHTGVCEIYYRQGPFQGYENSSASWIKAGEVSGLTALGGLTPIPIDVYVHITAGQTYGFYINRELEGGVAGTVYRPSETSNSTIATNSDLDITGGIAKSALFGEGINSPNSAVYGRVHYLEGFALPCNTATGQDFTFNTQQQINDFATNYAHCSNITLNNLVIGYATNDGFSNITDLTPLQNITTVTGELNIRRNPQLTTLNGLQNITSFNGNLRIERNDLLTNISALSNITSVGFLNIRDNAVLANLNGLHNLTTTSGYLYIRSNANLVNINALQNLTTIGTYIEIMDNDNLTNLDGLSGVTAINGNINIHENAVLTNILGLRNINPATITNSGGGLTIQNNPNLAVCNLPNFCTYLAGSGARTISGNKTTCINVTALTNACASACASVSGQNFDFSTQEQIDMFGTLYGHCTDITLNNVTIRNPFIYDLTPLQNITNITGFLLIQDIHSLTTLYGLNNLTSIGGYLGLDNTTSLIDISALSSVTTVGGSLYINKNTSITDLNGLQSLTSIGENLEIRNNPMLTNLNALSSLSSINGYLALVSNPLLTGISGLQNVNPSGIGGGYGLYIENNSQLSVCNLPNFCTYLSNPANPRTISGNAGDCISVTAVTNACQANCPTGNWTFNTQAQIDEFGALYGYCTDITLGNVVIGYISGSDTTDITDLTPLQNITALTGYLRIRNNPNLTDVNGLSALTSIGGYLHLTNNPTLTNVNGLSALTSIGTYLYVYNNPALTNVNGLSALQSIGWYLDIWRNPALTDIIGFNNLTSIGQYIQINDNSALTNIIGFNNLTSIGQYIQITDNLQLTQLSGFAQLPQVRGDLWIRNSPNLLFLSGFGALHTVAGEFWVQNTALQSINAFENLATTVGKLAIEDNPQLTDISKLQNVTYIGGSGLFVLNNAVLSACNISGFCTYLSKPSATYPRNISGNTGDCISEQAVTNACFWSNITPDDDNILYVNHNVSGSTQTGNSWANAIPQLADALKWAKQKYDADNTVFDAVPLKIYVATGTYKPLYRADNLDGSNPQDRDNAFVMVKNVQIFGGFEGNETTLEERNYATNPTILSGDIDGTNGLSVNDVYHVMVSVGNVGSALLDGFTVSGGYITSADGNTGITVNGSLVRYERGSGLSLIASSPQIRNVLFTGHRTYTGVVSHSAGSNATFVNTLFTGNTSQYGAVYNNVSSPVFINSTFSGNTGTDNANNGVAMRNITSHPKFYNTIVWGNQNANGSTNNIFNSGGANPTSSPEYYHSLVQGITTTDNGNLNGSTNPLFEDAVNGDFSLQTGSAAIAKGNNSYFSGLTIDAKDLAGNPRVYNHANNGTIDMGAYEYQELLPQSITFNALQGRSVGDADFDLTATASSNLPVTYTSSNPSVAVVIGNTVSIKNSGNTNIIASQSGNGDYAAATAVSQVLQITGTLPVTLLNFTAKADGNHAKLQWETANEKNAKGFEVYRSGDDKAFVKIGDVRTSLNVPLSTFNYTYTDQQPLNGNNYYKLVQIDDDGKSIDLGERAVTFNFQLTPVNLYPNPTTDKVNVVFKEGYCTAIIVADVNGGVLKVLEIQADQKQLELDLSSYASGVYLIRLQGKETKTYRVIKY